MQKGSPFGASEKAPDRNETAVGLSGAAGLCGQYVRERKAPIQNLIEIGTIHGDQRRRPAAFERFQAVGGEARIANKEAS